MNPNQLRIAAAKLANSLGISLYIRDGRIYQHGPGEQIDPPPSTRSSISHGRFENIRVEGVSIG